MLKVKSWFFPTSPNRHTLPLSTEQRQKPDTDAVLWGDLRAVLSRLVIAQARINQTHRTLHVLHMANDLQHRTQLGQLRRCVHDLQLHHTQAVFWETAYETAAVLVASLLLVHPRTRWVTRIAAAAFLSWFFHARAHKYRWASGTVTLFQSLIRLMSPETQSLEKL